MDERGVAAYAREKRFSAPLTERWLAVGEADAAALLGVARRLRLGENQFRDVLELAEGIAARRACAMADVLALDPVRSVLEGPLGRNEAVKALKLALRRLRYPQLTEAEERLGRLVKALRLPRGVRVEFAPHLEGSRVTVIVEAQSAPTLRAHAAALAEALACDEVDEIFRLLEGEW